VFGKSLIHFLAVVVTVVVVVVVKAFEIINDISIYSCLNHLPLSMMAMI